MSEEGASRLALYNPRLRTYRRALLFAVALALGAVPSTDARQLSEDAAGSSLPAFAGPPPPVAPEVFGR
ncbi:MAG: hypothetical protein OEW19_03430 [Acidobacteriota bacterium]|nr:hypothetical protein [Acidobacteriota bacterium]